MTTQMKRTFMFLFVLMLGMLVWSAEQRVACAAPDQTVMKSVQHHQMASARPSDNIDLIENSRKLNRLNFLLTIKFWTIFFASAFVIWWLITRFLLRGRPF